MQHKQHPQDSPQQLLPPETGSKRQPGAEENPSQVEGNLPAGQIQQLAELEAFRSGFPAGEADRRQGQGQSEDPQGIGEEVVPIDHDSVFSIQWSVNSNQSPVVAEEHT